jgi:hypothetical protein
VAVSVCRCGTYSRTHTRMQTFRPKNKNM